MKFRLSVLLLVPAIAVVVLASIIIEDRDSKYSEARIAAELGRYAEHVARLDQALGNEALVSASFSDDSPGRSAILSRPTWSGGNEASIGTQRAQLEQAQALTDEQVAALQSLIASSEFRYHPEAASALLTVVESLRYRSDVTEGRISPLQIADRYAYMRTVMLDALSTQTVASDLIAGVAPISGLSALVRARSAHLDERLTVELAIRYDTWAPGQHAAAIEALVIQEEQLKVAESHLVFGSSSFVLPLAIEASRNTIRQSMDVPPLTHPAWNKLSDDWLGVLDEQIAFTTSAMSARFAADERSAQLDRQATLASVFVTLAFAALMAFFVVIRLVQRVGRVTERALVLAADANAETEAIGDGGRDEIAQLAAAFDDMASQLRRSADLHAVESSVLEAIALGETIETILDMVAPLLGVDDLGQPYYAFSHHAPEVGAPPLLDSDDSTRLWLTTQTGQAVAELPDRMETPAALALAHMAQARFDDDARIQFQVRHDRLTGLLSRGTILDLARTALERSGRSRVGLLYVDLDGFKAVNDTYGHQSGDLLLRTQSRRLSATVALRRGSVGRLGGDEFLVVIPRLESNDDLMHVAHDVVEGLSGQVELDVGASVTSPGSVGCVLADRTMPVEQWIHEADLALYESKRSGGGRAVASTAELREGSRRAATLRDEVQVALRRREFIPFFQPVWGGGGTELSGFEALARWQKPGQGILPPSAFLPVVDEMKLAAEFDGAFFESVCVLVAGWTKRGLSVPYVSVNVSAARLEDPNFVEETLEVLERTGCDPCTIVVEVTEEGVMSDIVQNSNRLRVLRKAGLRVAADDFGKGYSSLAYLHQLPLDIVKVDRQFVDRIDESLTNRAIVGAVRELASAMGLVLIAEGVERQEELDQLIALGCDKAQGFLLGKPAPVEETVVLIGQHLRQTEPESNEWFEPEPPLAAPAQLEIES